MEEEIELRRIESKISGFYIFVFLFNVFHVCILFVSHLNLSFLLFHQVL